MQLEVRMGVGGEENRSESGMREREQGAGRPRRGPKGAISVPIAAAVHAECADCARGGISTALVAAVGGEVDGEKDDDGGGEKESTSELHADNHAKVSDEQQLGQVVDSRVVSPTTLQSRLLEDIRDFAREYALQCRVCGAGRQMTKRYVALWYQGRQE